MLNLGPAQIMSRDTAKSARNSPPHVTIAIIIIIIISMGRLGFIPLVGYILRAGFIPMARFDFILPAPERHKSMNLDKQIE